MQKWGQIFAIELYKITQLPNRENHEHLRIARFNIKLSTFEETEMNKTRLPQLLYFGLLFMLTACQVAGQSLSTAMLKPGDTIDGMSLTTGAQDAPPLWAFCVPVPASGNTITSDCTVPVLPRLAIGHLFAIADDRLNDLNWSELTWELSIDNQPVDLEAFGTFEYVTPGMTKSPSPVREVFKTFTAWDVVLTNLNPGEHTIEGLAQLGANSHTWIIHLTIQAPDGFPTSSVP